jgi:uncharacterized lipoprotein YmbA
VSSPRFATRWSTLLLLALAVSACVNLGPGTPPRAPTYVLDATVPASVLDPSGIAVGVGPVSIPGYLDRNEMVSREAANELRVDSHHSWGAPLNHEVQRILGENLARLLSSGQVITWPWSRHRELALRIPVHVLKFEPVAGKGVVLVARWELLTPDATQVLFTRQLEIVEAVPEAGPGPNAAGMSHALAALSVQIADSVRAQPLAQGAVSAR